MKKFKVFDVWFNVGLIILFILLSIVDVNAQYFGGNILFAAYYFVGGWQVISMVVHKYSNCFMTKKNGRSIYHYVTLISLLTMPVGSFIILLFTAPFMAIFYTILCYRETYIKMKRPLDDLK
jgi:hypothetical protein